VIESVRRASCELYAAQPEYCNFLGSDGLALRSSAKPGFFEENGRDRAADDVALQTDRARHHFVPKFGAMPLYLMDTRYTAYNKVSAT
jgi:hypothetical protein